MTVFAVTIDVPSASEAVIVLAQLDKRYFKELSGQYEWSIDFTLYPMRKTFIVGRSVHSALWERSAKMETKLTKGTYIVQACFLFHSERKPGLNFFCRFDSTGRRSKRRSSLQTK